MRSVTPSSRRSRYLPVAILRRLLLLEKRSHRRYRSKGMFDVSELEARRTFGVLAVPSFDMLRPIEAAWEGLCVEQCPALAVFSGKETDSSCPDKTLGCS